MSEGKREGVREGGENGGEGGMHNVHTCTYCIMEWRCTW